MRSQFGDLSSTAVTSLTLDLAGTPGSGIGDAQSDSVIVNGTARNDNIAIFGSVGNLAVLGLPAVSLSAGLTAPIAWWSTVPAATIRSARKRCQQPPPS